MKNGKIWGIFPNSGGEGSSYSHIQLFQLYSLFPHFLVLYLSQYFPYALALSKFVWVKFKHLCCWSPVAGVTLKLGTWCFFLVSCQILKNIIHEVGIRCGGTGGWSRKYAAICCSLIDMRKVIPHCGEAINLL